MLEVTLISIMSAQLLICKFSVSTSLQLFLPMALVTCMVRWLAFCQDPIVNVSLGGLCTNEGILNNKILNEYSSNFDLECK